MSVETENAVLNKDEVNTSKQHNFEGTVNRCSGIAMKCRNGMEESEIPHDRLDISKVEILSKQCTAGALGHSE